MTSPPRVDRAGDEVHLEIADTQHRLGILQVRAPRQRIDARQQLGEGEGLHEIVVAADVESVDAIVNAAQRGEEDDRHLVTDRPQRTHQRQTVEAGKHAIDDQDVVGFAHRLGKTIASIVQGLDDMALLGEAVGDVGGGFGIVFDDQDAHLLAPALWRNPTLRALPTDVRNITEA